jgi:hypothetical protein
MELETEGGEEQPVVSGQPCHLVPPGPNPSCHGGPCLRLWLHNGRGQCWYLWLILPLENTGMSLIGAAYWHHENVQGLYIAGPVPYWMWCSGELAPSLASGSTWENELCTSPGQHSTADPGGRGVGEPALRVRVQGSWPSHLSAAKWHGCGEGLPPITTCRSWENWPQGHESK